MNYLTLALRLIHIIGGIIWVGGALLMNFFVAPTLRATGDAGRQFAGHLMGKTAFPKIMLGAGLLTVLAGAYLYGVYSNWFISGWMMTGTGIGFGIGAVTGIAALVFGFMVGNTNRAMAALGAQIQGKPTDGQMAEMGMLRKRQVFVTAGNTICIIISIAMMASARFLG